MDPRLGTSAARFAGNLSYRPDKHAPSAGDGSATSDIGGPGRARSHGAFRPVVHWRSLTEIHRPSKTRWHASHTGACSRCRVEVEGDETAGTKFAGSARRVGVHRGQKMPPGQSWRAGGSASSSRRARPLQWIQGNATGSVRGRRNPEQTGGPKVVNVEVLKRDANDRPGKKRKGESDRKRHSFSRPLAVHAASSGPGSALKPAATRDLQSI